MQDEMQDEIQNEIAQDTHKVKLPTGVFLYIKFVLCCERNAK